MFKLESYITPILLSYVDKYIKNFRPEDSQVSLWGGDASFHNLDLRLDVLEEELQLPFNLVSGHIHELLIHVPWTKLASEPINITINTIECVLKLRGSYSPNADSANVSRERKRKSSQSKKQEIAAPPGYVQSLINKIVNNITINCNNLILKYVEEDIVISVNIKMLTFQSADGEWQPAFTEISPTQMIMRKLITLSDLTICLDKRNAAGKIEVYQEPILYRCSIEIRFLKQFYSSNSDKTLNTRIDVHCNRMEFSMTEQQIPMLLRIINLAIALQQRQLKKHTNVEIVPGSFGAVADEATTSDAYGESWAGWAWSFAANIFPTEDETNLEWNNMNNSESTLQCGVYIDNVIFTFKVSEYYSNDKGYYATRKVKYWPLLCLQLNGCYMDTVILGVEWTSFQMGIAEAILLPQGCCSCGLTDVTDAIESKYYLKTGTYNGNHLMNSLFDPNINPESPRKYFTISWDYYLNTISEAVLLEKTSAFAIDFLYHLEVPDDFSSEKLSEFENDLEYSNLVERSICRLVAGPSVVNVCSGLIHRLSTLYEVMKSYDYPPYVEPPVELKLCELHPPSEDDFDSLSNLIPKRIYQVTFLKPVFQIHLMDHPKFVPSKRDLFRKVKKSSGYFNFTNFPSISCPIVTIECETLDIKIIIPMYPKRLVYTTCQLPEPPDEMFNSCYFHSDINISGFSSQMIFTCNKKTTIILPFNVSCTYKSILFPNYWINPEIIHKEIITEIDSITLTATKAKLMVISKIIEKLIAMDVDEYKNSIFASSLLQDAPIDAGMVVLELYGEQLKWRTIKTISTESHKVSLDSFRLFALEPSEIIRKAGEFNETIINNEPNQVLIVSGPESSEIKSNLINNNSLFTLTLQFPRKADKCVHPPIVFFNLEEMKICIDPLFFQWLFYCPKLIDVKQESFWPIAENLNTYKPRALSDMSGASLQETPRRANTPHESIHSSSEREQNVHLSSPRPQTISKDPVTINSDNIYYDFLMKWYLVWTNIIVYGDIKCCTIYFPKQSLPAIGSQGIEDAINMSLKLENPIEIMVIKLPSASIRTAGQKQSLTRYTSHLPVTLPNTIWTSDKQSFPWTVEIKNLCCFTLQNKRKLFFLKPISANLTMSLSIKYRNQTDATIEIKSPVGNTSKSTFKHVSFEANPVDNISSFSVYVHIDNTPIEIALSEIQVRLISSILLALYEVLNKLFPPASNYISSSIDDKYRSKEDTASVLRKSHSRSQSPIIIKDDIHDTISEKTPTSIQTEMKNVEEDTLDIKFIVWLQWTITRLRIKLFGYNMDDACISKSSYLNEPTLKLIFECEDIMTSLDLQQIYSKFKLKIVTAGILHYKRSSANDDWKPGDYLGTVMRSREELPSTEKQDDFGFMSVTITKAKCGHVHSKWGTTKKHRLSEMKMDQQITKEKSETRYISEVVATLQPIDFIVSAKVLKSFYMVLEPILIIFTSNESSQQSKTDKMSSFNNSNLPLAYLDCHGIRLVVVSSTNEPTGNHDICIIEIENINLVPAAENPICRNPIRPDIYQRAAQTRILNVPGSNIEDRQYQINLKSVSVNTGAWIEFKQVLTRDTSVISSLHTMNENPALEWNNLEWGQSSLTPNLSLLPIVQKFDECIVVAPAILCPNNGLICGCSLELNCISDIEIFISLQQFRLISVLTAEFINFATPAQQEITERQPKFTYFNQKYNCSNVYNKSDEISMDYAARDSGIDTMDVNSEITSKTKESFTASDRRNILKLTGESRNSDITHAKYTSSSQIINYCPTEFLITGGNISVSLYKITNQKFIEKKNIYSPEQNASPNKDDAGYDGSEEESIDVPVSAQKVQPLLYILISQLNFYLSDNTFEKKINFSCFDIYIKTNESKHTYIMGLPTPKDHQIFILETKSGIPDRDTGIPPAFITFKWLKSIGKPLALSVDFGRPIRIFYSLEKINHLLYLKEHILENIIDIIPLNVSKEKTIDQHDLTIDSFVKYKNIKDTFKGINNFNLKMSQIVFVCKTTCGHEMTFSLESCASFLGFSVRPEKITNTLIFKAITITTNIEDSTNFLLNPWSLTLKSNFFWESWQSYNSDPQTQILIDNDCFNIDVGPEQLKCVNAMIKELNHLQETFNFASNETEHTTRQLINIERDQYYKDDLRAGAFQFVDATSTTDPNELPLPYQVMFWNGAFAAMAWRYPQPRILAKVRVFPVPFKLTNEQSKNQQVLCFLEYWSECHGAYKSIAQFHLSESEMYYLELPTSVPQIAVSCTWRVVLTFSDSRLQKTNKHFVSARALAACMRVDSYFNSILIPRLQFAVNCFHINVSFYNQFNKKLALIMPKKLRNYTPDGLIPDNHCFLLVNATYTNIFGAYWCSNVAAIDFKTHLKCSALDYASLMLQPIIEPVEIMLNLTLAETVKLNVITDSIKITFSPAIAHTLAISSQLWTQNWLKNTNGEPPDMIIITRYVICNDSNIKIRFGQTNTDENILLPSRFLHLYCWRSQNYNRSIRIGIEQNNWRWSKPINIDKDRVEYIPVSSEKNCCLIVTVRTLSATQKQIIFSGQLVICNMLLDQFELKVLPYNEPNKDLALKNAERHIVHGKTTAPTILIDTDCKLALRLRFLSLESAWSGDIPLEENTRGSQPWLVKIPLQERGQFLSIWCRVIDRKRESRQILVMLWPLFMLRSNLPVKTHVFVETSALNVRLETNLKGRGELQQLYCPGTIDHSHNLIFDSSSSSSPHIPINYSLIDHKEIFKKIEKDDIFDILDYLGDFDESKWPYIDNNLDTFDLNCDVQPIAHVQTIYRNVCKYSSALLVELIPWCLLINTLGVPISIIIKGNESLRINHYGVVTPPKLENTFNIGVEIDDVVWISPLLQLAKADWSQSFYMPKINGIIPLEGNIKIPVKCDLQMCMMSITSSVVNNLRILQISSNYIMINHTKLQLEVTCIALPPNNDKIYDIFDFSQSNSILLESHLDKKNIGVPLTSWNCVEDISDTVSDYNFHVIISLENKFAQSSPIQIDNGLSRKCICLYSHTENIPLVLIAQEHKGQIYLSIHPDIHPQLLIKNKCSQQIFCAQHDATNESPVPMIENHYINWNCNIYSDTESYYTMPSVSENFPNVDSNSPEKLILAVKCEDVIPSYQWSQEINISIFNEQYVRIPQYGDIKLSIKKCSSTIVVTIDSVTEVEISAQDIRSRLLMQSAEHSSNILHDHKSNNLTKSTSQYEIREKNHALENIKSTSNIPESLPQYSSRFLTDTDFINIDKQCKALKNCHISNNDRWSNFNVAVVFKSVILSLAVDNHENGFEKINLTNIICDYVGVTLQKKEVIDCSLSVANIQCDNQLFNTGSYDFPVILKGENSNLFYEIDERNKELSNFIDEIKTGADLIVDLRLEIWEDKNIHQTITEIQEIKVKFGPLSLYIEDIYITKLIEYLSVLSPPQLVVWSIEKKPKTCTIYAGMVKVPEYLSWESKLLAKPLFLQNLSIEPMALLLSLHSSVKLYIALDRSPLQFNKFERKNVTTTPYRLGQALTMHYLSDAIFGAGWVVGSLELLGSPSGLARTVGSGLRDFISLPYNGLIQGPWAFLVGITHGSASLMRHITAGTLDSVTKLASSVARNLDRLTLDVEHQKRTEELRRQRPQGLAQGFLQGLTGLGISLLGAVGGIAHHSLQSVMNDGATPRGLVAGVGLGLVGVFTKPLSGAAELVALTGQGLLQGAGWNPLPEPRSIKMAGKFTQNSILKYTWKVLQSTAAHNKFIAIIEVEHESKPILLIVSFDTLILINIAEDLIKRVISVSEINDVCTDGLMEIRINLVQPIKPPPQNAEAFEIEMDPVSRARVADYVKNSAGLVQLSPLGSNSNSDDDSISLQRPVISLAQPCVVFHVNSAIRNYLCDILELVRQQNKNNTFRIL